MTDQGYSVQTFCSPSWSLKGKATKGNRWHIPTQKSRTQPRPLQLARGPRSLHTLKSSKLRKKWKRGKTEKQWKTEQQRKISFSHIVTQAPQQGGV